MGRSPIAPTRISACPVGVIQQIADQHEFLCEFVPGTFLVDFECKVGRWISLSRSPVGLELNTYALVIDSVNRERRRCTFFLSTPFRKDQERKNVHFFSLRLGDSVNRERRRWRCGFQDDDRKPHHISYDTRRAQSPQIPTHLQLPAGPQ